MVFYETVQKMKKLTCCIWLFMLVAIVIIGALSFTFIEKSRTVCESGLPSTRAVLSSNKYNLTSQQLDLLTIYMNSEFTKKQCRHYSFVQWIYFSMNLLLTIDSYEMHPISDAGKIFALIYTLVGLPISIFTVYMTSQQIIKLLQFGISRYLSRYLSLKRAKWIEICTLFIFVIFVLCISVLVDQQTGSSVTFPEGLYQWILVLLSIGSYREFKVDIEYGYLFICLFRFLGIVFLLSCITLSLSATQLIKGSITPLKNRVHRRRNYVFSANRDKKKGVFYINEGITEDKFHNPSRTISIPDSRLFSKAKTKVHNK